jgi:uncharacterized membrane protein YcgQ (UPF0703/DUF1980 family)
MNQEVSDVISQRHEYKNHSICPNISILQHTEVHEHINNPVRIIYIIYHFTLLNYTFIFRIQLSLIIHVKSYTTVDAVESVSLKVRIEVLT